METTYEKLDLANKDLCVLSGKEIELNRERNRLNNHRQVFLDELKRIESELDEVNTKLSTIKSEYSKVSWNVTKLRFKLFFELIFRCFNKICALLSFLFLNSLHVIYVTLSLGASLAKTIIETHQTDNLANEEAVKLGLAYVSQNIDDNLKKVN